MVLRDKEELCNWFKSLDPRTRIDYMCGLLQLCLPLELRFIGTVLEDIGRENFIFLREAEVKSNNVVELAKAVSHDFCDHHFRAKTLVNLALLHSANTACAEIIFNNMERQFGNLKSFSHDKIVMEETLTLLTLACHHPAFSIKQRLRIGEVLKNTEDYCHRHHPNNSSNPAFPQFSKGTRSCYTPPASGRPAGIITSLAVHGIRDDHHSKKSGPEYEIFTTWSSGEITQSFKRHKELQDLHHQIFNKFSDRKPDFPNISNHRKFRQSKEEKVSLMNSYLSELSKVHHILSCDIITQAFHNGKLVQAVVHPPAPSQPVFYPAYVHDNRYYGHYPDGSRVSYVSAINPVSQISSAPTKALSSSTTSPANSRSNSPVNTPAACNKIDAKSATNVVLADEALGDSVAKGDNALLPHHQGEPSLSPQVETCQFLRLLDLEKYTDNLANYSVQEVNQMSSEEMTKLDIPPDAQIKLQSKLANQKLAIPDINGVVHLPSSISKPDQAMHSISAWPAQVLLSPESGQQPALPYNPSQPYIISQIAHPVAAENSPSASEVYTPCLSPGVHSMTDSPPSSLASPSSVHLEKLVKTRSDSSGSEEDVTVQDGESPCQTVTVVSPQQSVSLPHINHQSPPPGHVDKGKMVVMPPPQSSPVINADVRDNSTPPMGLPMGMLNGFETRFVGPNTNYISQPVGHPLPIQHHQQAQQHPRFKSAQPTHVNHRRYQNIINMPCVDMSSHPPLLPHMMNKNSGSMNPVLPHPMHHYQMMPPNMQNNPGMLHQANGGGPQQLSLAADSNGTIPTLNFSMLPAPTFMPPHSRGGPTTLTNSSVGMNAPSSHHPGHHPIVPSHSPSPIASSVSITEHMPMAFGHSNVSGDGSELRQEDATHNKPSPLSQNNNNSSLSHLSKKAESGTPSPPLVPKQIVTSCATGESSNHPSTIYNPQIYVFPTNEHFSTPQFQQNHLPPFPNGLAHDMFVARFQGLPPNFYGSTYTPPIHNNHNVNNGTPIHHPAVNNNGNKSTCYNCGKLGHRGNECRESKLDSMTNSYRLNVGSKLETE